MKHKNIYAALAIAALAVGIVALSGSRPAQADHKAGHEGKIVICHATSGSNEYVRIEVSVNAAEGGHLDENGTQASGHETDIIDPPDGICPGTTVSPTPIVQGSPSPIIEVSPTPTPAVGGGGPSPTPVVLGSPSPIVEASPTPTPIILGFGGGGPLAGNGVGGGGSAAGSGVGGGTGAAAGIASFANTGSAPSDTVLALSGLLCLVLGSSLLRRHTA